MDFLYHFNPYIKKVSKMILIYLLLGVIITMLLSLTFIPKSYLKDGGWSDSEIDSVKKFFHTTNLYK